MYALLHKNHLFVQSTEKNIVHSDNLTQLTINLYFVHHYSPFVAKKQSALLFKIDTELNPLYVFFHALLAYTPFHPQ